MGGDQVLLFRLTMQQGRAAGLGTNQSCREGRWERAQLGLRHASQRRGPQNTQQSSEPGTGDRGGPTPGSRACLVPAMTRGNRPGVRAGLSHTTTDARRKSCTTKAEALGPVGETRVSPGPAPPRREGRASLPLGGCTGSSVSGSTSGACRMPRSVPTHRGRWGPPDPCSAGTVPSPLFNTSTHVFPTLLPQDQMVSL